MDAVGPELLARLLDEQGAALTLYARQWCGAPEDVVQEAFVRLAYERPVPGNIVGWLYRVVRNGAISAARSSARRARHESAAARREESWFVPSRSARIDAEDASAALQSLPLDQRETIVARLWGGLSFEEIADLTGTTAQHGTPPLCRRVGGFARQAEHRPCGIRFAKTMSDEKNRSAGDDTPAKLPPELQALEAELALLRPRADRLSREQVLFLAGQASVLGRDPVRRDGPGRWAWPTAFAAMTVLAASLLAVLLFRPEPAVAERIVYVPIQSVPERVAADADDSRTKSRQDPTILVTQRQQTPNIASEPSDLLVRPGRAAELQFSLFEHLLAERSYGQMRPSPTGNVADAVNHSLWSASSLNELLDESPTTSPVDSFHPLSSESSGAKS